MGIVDEGLMDAVKDFNRERTTKLGYSTSTGIISLDAALGGRLPHGAIEIFGPHSVGKTTLLNEMIAAAQAAGSIAALCPSEYVDIPYMRNFGIDLNSLALITGNTGEYVLEGACKFIEDHRILGRPCFLAIDSATGLRPEDDQFGQWNLMIDTFLEVALPELGEGSCIVMTDQIRTKRSIRPDKFFVDGQVDSTARRIVDAFSARLELSRTDVTESYYTMMVNVVASMFSTPATILPLRVEKGGGVDTMLDLVRVAVEFGAVQKEGSWYSFKDQSIGQGEQHVANILGANPELAKLILDEVMEGA